MSAKVSRNARLGDSLLLCEATKNLDCHGFAHFKAVKWSGSAVVGKENAPTVDVQEYTERGAELHYSRDRNEILCHFTTVVTRRGARRCSKSAIPSASQDYLRPASCGKRYLTIDALAKIVKARNARRFSSILHGFRLPQQAKLPPQGLRLHVSRDDEVIAEIEHVV